MSIKNTLRAVAFTTLVVATASANAVTSSTSLGVTFVVATSCTINAGDSITFSPGSQAGKGTLTVACTKNTAYAVALSPTGGSATGAGSMSSTAAVPSGGTANGDKVAYQLNQTATGTPWGNTVGTPNPAGGANIGGNEKAGAGSGASQTLSVYANVTDSNVKPDTYADTIAVVLTY